MTTTQNSQPKTPDWLAWDEARAAFLDQQRARSPLTARAYEADLRSFFAWADVGPWSVTPALAIRYAAALRRAGRAPATVNRRLAALSAFYAYVQRDHVALGNHDGSLWPADRANPFAAVHRARISPYGRAQFPTTEQLQRLLAAVNPHSLTGARDLALLYTVATTCLRSAAVLGLRWGHIQPRDDGDFTLSYVYKGGAERRAVLPRQAYLYICAYLRLASRPPESLAADALVFVALRPDAAAHLIGVAGGDPRPLSNSFVNRILKKYGRRAGIPAERCHLHGLRHAGARLRVEIARATGGRVDLIELMHVLGHSNLSITQIYADTVLEEPQDPGLAAAAAALQPALGSPDTSPAPTRKPKGPTSHGPESDLRLLHRPDHDSRPHLPGDPGPGRPARRARAARSAARA